MADTEKAFSDLDTAGQLDNTDIFALSKVSGNSWISAKATLTALATKIATDVNYTSDLQTTSKTITGAINEIAQGGGGGGGSWTDVTGTLTAGSTSITLSNVAITTTSTIEVFNDLDVPYNSKTLSTGSITLTFDAQSSDMSVKVRVS